MPNEGMTTDQQINEWASAKVAALLSDAALVAAVVLTWLSDLEGWE
jgi:hypothetical protein